MEIPRAPCSWGRELDGTAVTVTVCPPRRNVKRGLRVLLPLTARTEYIALYDLNRADDAARSTFLDKVGRRLRTF